MTWILPLAAAGLASSATLLASGAILAFGRKAERAAVWLLPYAVGTLLGAAILGLLPEALEHAPAERVSGLFLAGMLAFLLIERLLRSGHGHRHGRLPHTDPAHPSPVDPTSARMLLWGDALHNFVDGLILGVSFRAGPEAGLAATLAVLAHEAPQEIGDFAVLLGSGMSRPRALLLNYLSATTVLPGAVLAFAWSSSGEAIAILLPLAAGGLVYIALADLLPALDRRGGAGSSVAQMALVLTGIATTWSLLGLKH